MSEQADVYRPLWITKMARYSGVNNLVKLIGYPRLGPYIFVFVLLFVDVGVLSTIGYLTADRAHPLLENPLWYIAILGLWFCVWIIRDFARTYEELSSTYDVDSFEEINKQDGGFYDIRRSGIKYGIYALLITVHGVNYIILGGWGQVAEIEGPIIGLIKFGIIVPFGYFPVIAELTSVLIASFVVVPKFISNKKYKIQFDDPLNIGGLEGVGELIKKSSYVYALGLLLILFWNYGPALLPINGVYDVEPGSIEILQYVLAWILGIALILYGTFVLHLYMQRQKREKIEEIDARIRAFGDDERGIPDIELDEQSKSQIELEYLKLEEVRNMRTWPFTAAAQERIMFSALFPMALERVLNLIV